MATATQFDAKHGDFVTGRGMLFFQDGASREINPQGLQIEPPPDVFERCKVQKIFWAETLRAAVSAFDQEKRRLLAEAKSRLQQKGNIGGPPLTLEDATRVLNELKRKVDFCKRNLDEIVAVMEANKPRAAVTAEIEAENRTRMEEFVRAVQQIQI